MGETWDILFLPQITFFSTVQSVIKLSSQQTYCTTWYGCEAWQLGITLSDEANVEWCTAFQLAGNENFHVNMKGVLTIFPREYFILQSVYRIKIVHWWPLSIKEVHVSRDSLVPAWYKIDYDNWTQDEANLQADTCEGWIKCFWKSVISPWHSTMWPNIDGWLMFG